MKAYTLIIVLIAVLTIGLATGDAFSQEPTSKPMTSYEMSRLLGTDVENPQGEHLGRVTDFMVDSTGRIELAIILQDQLETGNTRHVAVPFDALSYVPSTHRFTLNTTSGRWASAPTFDPNQDLTNRKFAEEVYRYFGLEPYWTEGREDWIRSDQDAFDLVG